MPSYQKFRISFFDGTDTLHGQFEITAPSTRSKVFDRKLAEAIANSGYTLPKPPANAVKTSLPGREPFVMLWQAMMSPWSCCDLEDGTEMVPVFRRQVETIK